MKYLIFISIGLIGGTLSGLLGIGGGVVMIPMLIYFTNTDIKAATAISMVQIFFTSSFGSLFNYLEKNIKIRYAFYFGISSMVFSFAGSFLTRYIPETVIKTTYLFAVTASLAMFIARSFITKENNKIAYINKSDTDTEKKKILKLLPLGAVAGFIGGILGVGGGFLYVPVLIFFLGLSLKSAIATSLAIVFFSSIPGVIGKIISVDFNWITALIISAGAIGGSRLGVYIKSKAKPSAIRIVFIIVLIVIIVRVVIDLISKF